MKKFIKYSLLPVLISAALSCKKDFLEIAPKGKLIAQTVNDYDLLLNNASLSSIGSDAQLFMGDEVAAFSNYFNSSELRVQRLFKWADTIYQPNENAPELNTPLLNLYTYNKIIREVMNATSNTTQGITEKKKSIQAEALAGRAWTNFLLINYYGKPYAKASAATDPGFPIITAADIDENKFTRASVQQMYDFIIKDLTDALPFLPEKTTSRIRMSKAAAEALLGKVYVFMSRYQDALPLFNAAIADAAASPLNIRLYDYNVTLSPGGSFFPITLFGPTSPVVFNNEENLYSKTFTNFRGYVSNDIILTPDASELYGSSDLRLLFYSRTPFPAGANLPNGMLRRANGSTASCFGMLLPDIYLLRAECKARLNDLPGATADVKILREKRMPVSDADVPANISGDKNALLNFIMEERIREFAVAGFRWFDMRRLSVDPLFSNAIYKHAVYAPDGTIVASYTLKPERLTLKFPQKLMDQNPGMENNP